MNSLPLAVGIASMLQQVSGSDWPVVFSDYLKGGFPVDPIFRNGRVK
jgi:hypothetical protein